MGRPEKNISNHFWLGIFLVALVVCNQSWGDNAKQLLAGTALDWQVATREEKLSAARLLMAELWASHLLNDEIDQLKDYKPLEKELVRQLDAAFEQDKDSKQNEKLFTNQKVTDTAVLLMVAMGWINL